MKKQEIFDAYPEVRIYLDKILAEFDPEKVILFGSKAKKEAKKTSDTDFAIVTSHPFDENQIIGALDIINYGQADAYLQDKIDREGILLYERKDKEIS